MPPRVSPAGFPAPPLKAVFMGTPDFAARVLERVLDCPGVEVAAVYTQPDRPAGRGHRNTPPPVKVLAEARGLPVLQPLNFKNAEDCRILAGFAPDVLLVVAYGLLLPQTVLDIPRRMPINVHASLLPKLRGAAPIQRAIMNGDTVTGISIMRMEAGLDTGPVLAQKALAIGIDDTAQTLHDELAQLGGRLLVECLEKIHKGDAPRPFAQDDSHATYAAKLSKTDGRIDWNRPVLAVHAQVRGVTPWPGARTTLSRPNAPELPLIFAPGRFGPELRNPAKPGTLLGLDGDCLAVACADRAYLVPAVQPAGKGFIDARSFFNGYIKSGAAGCFFS